MTAMPDPQHEDGSAPDTVRIAIDPLTASEADPRLSVVAAESALLAACFLDPEAATGILNALRPAHLTSDDRRSVLSAIQSATTEGVADIALVADELRHNGFSFPPAPFLAALLESNPTTASWQRHLRSVTTSAFEREKRCLRDRLSDPRLSDAEQDLVIAQIAEQREATGQGERSVYDTRRVSIDDITSMTATRRKNTYFVEGIIPTTGLFIVFGNSGSCKSWAMLDAALRSISETPGYFMGLEGARVHPVRSVLWIYGHEDRGSDHEDQDGRPIDLPVSRTIELLRRSDEPLDRDPATSIEFVYCRGRTELLAVIASATAGDHPPRVTVIDTVTSVVPATLDMKNGEVAEFYGDLKDAAVAGDMLIVPIGHPRKISTDAKGRSDPLDKDNLLGGAAITGVISGSLGIHAAKPEDVEPDGAGIRIKLAKRNKVARTGFTEARVHWDAERHVFFQGQTPSESRESRNHITRLAYLTAVRDAARRAGVADGEFVTVRSIRPPEGFTDPDGDPYWPANMTRFRNAIVAAGLLDVGPEPRVTRVSLTARALTEILRFDPEEYGMEGIG